MGTIATIALRNVLRHKRRTAITAIVMTAGIALFIAADSMLLGMDRLTIDNMVAYTESFMKVRHPDYVANLQGAPLNYGIEDYETALQRILKASPELVAGSPRTRFVATITKGRDSIPVLATAVDPSRDASVFELADSLVSGTWLSSEENAGVLLGKSLAAELGLESGDWLTVSATTVWDNLNADEYQVAGIVDSPMPEINDAGLFLSLGDAWELLGTENLVTELSFRAKDYAKLDAMLSASDRAAAVTGTVLPGLQADSLNELAKDYLAMRAMKGKASYFIILTVLLIAAVGIVNTILMSVYARVREIGVLKAYGMEKKDIQRLFTLEGVMVGIVGSIGGVILGTFFVWLLTRFGFDMGSMVGNVDMGGLPLKGTLYGEWNPPTMVSGFLFGVIVALVASRIPARMAARMEASRALRFV